MTFVARLLLYVPLGSFKLAFRPSDRQRIEKFARFQIMVCRDCVMLIKGACLVKQRRSRLREFRRPPRFPIHGQFVGNHTENHTRPLGGPQEYLAIINL